jgi:hypothetical protein
MEMLGRADEDDVNVRVGQDFAVIDVGLRVFFSSVWTMSLPLARLPEKVSQTATTFTMSLLDRYICS